MIRSTTAVAFFQETAGVFHRSSMQLIGSATVCFLTGAYATIEAERRDYNDTFAALKEAVTREGLKTAMMYKYVGLARQLTLHLIKKYPLLDGAIHDVLDSKTPKEATKQVIAYLDTFEVDTLDALGEFLGGRYQRSDTPTRAINVDVSTAETGGNDEPVEREHRVSAKSAPAAIAEVMAESDPVVIMQELVAEIDDVTILQGMVDVLNERITELTPKTRKRSKRSSLHDALQASAH